MLRINSLIGYAMKSVITSALFGLVGMLASFPAYAVMADPTPRTVKLPDGNTVTLVLHGDEYFNYTTTLEDNTVVFNPDTRAWEYARLDDASRLVSTGERAVDGVRALTAVKNLKPKVSASQRNADNMMRAHQFKAKYDYSQFRGLVILVEYNDAPFSRPDIHEIFDDMVNKRGYDGYMTNTLIPSKVECTGSVRDYYYDNSSGVFDPQFDVVGPVSINYSQHYANQSAGAQALVNAALRAADSMVDYSLYDTDGNGQVDMVYFIFSGAGSNYSGNDATLLWPHASTVMNMSLDGVSFGRYACSTELYGAPANKQLDGIGTMCHEFSHVLGLPDLYDVDYETGGQAIHPQRWSLMASGSYLNKSRTPCGYSLFERYMLGFTTPRLISEPGTYTIMPLAEGDIPDGCCINSAVDNEFFLLEYRTKTGWDEYLPGEGMLVHRVDCTNTSVWVQNKVNANTAHTYYDLLRATPSVNANGTVTDSAGDPFPGSGDVRSITNTTDPSMRSWTMASSPLVVENIGYTDDGNISFTVRADNTLTLVEDFATMELTNTDCDNMQGRFTTWSFASGAYVLDDNDGSKYAAMVRGSVVACDRFDGNVETCTIKIDNPTSYNAVFRFYYSNDNGLKWVILNTISGTSNPTAPRNAETTLNFSLAGHSGASYKLMQFSGSDSEICKIREIAFGLRPEESSAIEPVVSDYDADSPAQWYNLQGMRIASPGAAHGIFIVRQGGRTFKVFR